MMVFPHKLLAHIVIRGRVQIMFVVVVDPAPQALESAQRDCSIP
jgi:hypothetical protein